MHRTPPFHKLRVGLLEFATDAVFDLIRSLINIPRCVAAAPKLLRCSTMFGIRRAREDVVRDIERIAQILKALCVPIGIGLRRFPTLCRLGGNFGAMLGLPNDWMYQVIKQVGNYSESYERTVGMGSPLKLKRGANELWTKGGLLFTPPFQ